MSVMSMNSRMAMAEKLSVPQLQQAIQSGSLPAYIGVPLMETKMRDQQRAQPMQQAAPPAQPIAQEVMAQARGIDAVPSNLPVSGYSYGGIVAFAEGGDVEDEDREEERDQAEYAAMIQAYMNEAEAAGLEGLRVNRTKDVEKGAIRKADGGIVGLNNGGAIRFQNRGLVEDVDVLERMRTEDPDGYAQMMFGGIPPSSDTLEYGEAGSGNINNPFMRGETANRAALNYRLRPRGGVAKGREVRKEDLPLSALDFDADAPSSQVTPRSVPAPLAPMPSEFPEEGASSVAGVPFMPRTDRNAGQRNQAASLPPSAQGSSTSATADRPRSSFDEFMQDLKASREDLAKQKQEDKYMALISAGLGMMGGTSPNALANIGQGAQAGVASYAASGKQRAAEKAALDKNMLLSQRYKSMEDIAGRTADINEARYQAAAAARAAGGEGRGEEQVRKQIADIGRLAENRFRTLSANASKADQYLDPAGYRKAQEALTNDPELNRYNTIIKQLTNQMYGLSDEAPAPAAPSNVMRFDAKGNLIK